MTREQAKEFLPLIEAFAEGKTIQFNGGVYGWKDSSEPTWDTSIEYRIKPEPKFRPYKNAGEFLQAMKEHGPYIKINNFYQPALSVRNEGIVVNHLSVMYKELSSFPYSWQDNTPCGIMEE